MTINFGEVPINTTLYIPFPSYSSAGASVTLTGLAVTDIEIYKDGSVTQRASDNGYALLDTDGIDFDGITGVHGFSVDLSDNSTAGFYALGSQYWVVVSTVTIDSQTVTLLAATFRLGLPKYTLLGTASAGSSSTFTMSGGVATDDYYVGQVAWPYAGTGLNQPRAITSYVQSTGVFTVAPAYATLLDSTSQIAIVAPASSGLNAATNFATSSDVSTLTTAISDSETNVLAAIAPIDANVEAILLDTGTDGVAIAASSINAAAISADAGTEIGTAVWASATRTLTAATNLDALLTTALTESYATLGATASITQLLYEMRAILAENSVAGTTVTAHKLDGATVAATYGIDSATAPTSITRLT